MTTPNLGLRALLVVVVALAVVACGNGSDDASDGGGAGSTQPAVSPSSVTSAPASSSAPASTGPANGSTIGTPTSSEVAIWPASGVVFSTPEDAALDFLTNGLGLGGVDRGMLGEFQQGDSRSGELEVLFRGEDGSTARIARSLLLLRRLGPDNGWFVLAAVNDHASITDPVAMDEVTAGPLAVSGQARGFEGSVTISAGVAGSNQIIDQVVTQAGSLADAEPFAVTLDLSTVTPDTVVMLLVRGSTGLESDPGDFGAIAVRVVS